MDRITTDGLNARARATMVDLLRDVRWDWWIVLEWRWYRVAGVTALEHLEQFASTFSTVRSQPSAWLAVWLHDDEGHPHAHAVLRLSRQLRRELADADAVRRWLRARWQRGPVWCQPYDAERSSRPGGAIAYAARDPGSYTFSW